MELNKKQIEKRIIEIVKDFLEEGNCDPMESEFDRNQDGKKLVDGFLKYFRDGDQHPVMEGTTGEHFLRGYELVQFYDILEEEFNIELPDDDMENYGILKMEDLVNYININQQN